MAYSGPNMIAVNVSADQVKKYLDTGFLYPVVVPPANRKLFGQPVGVWCVGDDTTPGNSRIGFGGKTQWRKLTANPNTWLYCCKVDLELLMSPRNAMSKDPIAEMNAVLAKQGMKFTNAVAMGGSQECAADNMQTDSIWQPCRDRMAQQIADVWFDSWFHHSIRLQQKMVANKQMSAQDFWEMAGPVHSEECECNACI